MTRSTVGPAVSESSGLELGASPHSTNASTCAGMVADSRRKPSESRRQAPGAPPSDSAAVSSRRKQIDCELLDPADYADWDRFVDKSPHGTVFHYSWWLENVAPDFRIVVTRDENGAIVGGLPLPRHRRFGLRLLHSPKLAPYLGPIFDLSGAGGTCDELFLMRSRGEALGRYVDAFDSFRCLAGATSPDLQGFLWAGFRVHLAYTFRFPAGRSPDDVTAGMTRTHLQKLTKARRLNLSVTRDGDVSELISLNKMTFENQGLSTPYNPDLLRRLWPAARARGNAQLYVARTVDGVPAAALLTVNDLRTTYQIVSGAQKGLRDVPAAYLVLWHALQDALAAGRTFDFEGSSIRGVEAFYRRWGAAAMPVWCIEKSNSWRGNLLQFLLQIRIAASKNNLPS